MEIDHLFIFSTISGKEADHLVECGFIEGSSRLHPGQGTINRKFYFENFFLEILWVVNEEEIKSETTSKTKLWERSQFVENGNSPFGLCLFNSNSTDKLFENSETYQPDYFPEGMSIDILTNEKHPKLPWTFRLPYRGERKTPNEPTQHTNGIKKLTRAEFEIPFKSGQEDFRNYFKRSENIEFKNGTRTHLILDFDNSSQKSSIEFAELSLTIRY